jgi:hypothetical protein
MMAKKSTTEQFEVALQGLIGKKIWCVIAGAGAGSEVHWGLGRKIKRKHPLKNLHLSQDARNYDSEYSIMIWGGSAWRLETNTRYICGAWDSNEEGGPMLVGLQRLLQRKIQEIEVLGSLRDLRIRFSGGITLRTFRVTSDTNFASYSLFCPEATYSIDRDGKIAVELG